MGRIFTSSILIILLVTSGILFWQWHVYSEEKESSVTLPSSKVEQYVQIQQNNQSLQVTQKLSNLQKGTYEIDNPLKVKYTIEGQEKANNVVSVPEDNQSVTFHYIIPFNSKDGSSLLTDWVLELRDIQTVKSTVEVTVSSNVKGSWAAAAPQIGSAKKEFIDYYVFEQAGPVFPVYYQLGDMKQVKIGQGPFIYFEDTMKPDVNKISSVFSQYPEMKNNIVIFTTKHKEQKVNHLIMLNSVHDVEKLNEKLSDMYLDSIFPFENQQQKWQQQVINNLYSNKQSGGTKTIAMEKILREELFDTELEMFIDKVLNEKQALTSVRLDQILSEVKSKNTTFFSDNSEEEKSLSPMIYSDKRGIMVNRNSINEEMIYKDDSKLLPLKPIIMQAGFEYSYINNEHILLTKDGDSLRLYPGKKVFILNGTDYSVLSTPIIIIQNQVYIYNHWLEDIFGLRILEEDEEILITST